MSILEITWLKIDTENSDNVIFFIWWFLIISDYYIQLHCYIYFLTCNIVLKCTHCGWDVVVHGWDIRTATAVYPCVVLRSD
jgi:hypothetical protein